LRAEVLRPGFVAPFHPDARQRRVDKKITRPQGMRAFSGCQRRVEITPREIHFGESMPGFERVGRGFGRARKLHDRRGCIAEGVIGGGVFNEGLEFVARHVDSVSVSRKKGRTCRTLNLFIGLASRLHS
jgi:hypothetical protein